jgi:hypothetical protein
MNKKAKIIIIAVCIAALLLGCAIGAYFYKKNKITVNINDTLPDGGGKRATVILLGGQSNASGCSLDEYLERNVSAEKYEEYEKGYDNVYINYRSGIYKTSDGFVKCATRQGELDGAFGPELGLADKLNELYPDETFFIIKCAWGGSNLFSQWLSPSSEGKTGNLYRQFVAFVDASIEYLVSKNYDVKIEGMCWMQGESDAFMTDAAENYGVHLTNLIEDIRKRFDSYASEDGIAFIDAYIAENPMFWVYYEMVNECKTEVALSSPMNAVINTSDLSCSNEPEGTPDIPHYDSLSEIALGHRFAEALAPYLD